MLCNCGFAHPQVCFAWCNVHLHYSWVWPAFVVDLLKSIHVHLAPGSKCCKFSYVNMRWKANYMHICGQWNFGCVSTCSTGLPQGLCALQLYACKFAMWRDMLLASLRRYEYWIAFGLYFMILLNHTHWHHGYIKRTYNCTHNSLMQLDSLWLEEWPYFTYGTYS